VSTTTTAPAVERVHPPLWLINHFVNPVMRRVLRKSTRKMGDELLLLCFRGRRTGTPYEVPVGYRHINGRIAVVTTRDWRKNFRGGADVEVVLRGKRRTAHATLLEEPSEVARVHAQIIGEIGADKARRWLGLKINVDRPPTLDELTDVARGAGVGVIWIDL
jgi:F420H(2)-dependent quinone reductase